MLVSLELFKKRGIRLNQCVVVHPFLEVRSLYEQNSFWLQQPEAMSHRRDWVWQMFEHVHQSYDIKAASGYFEPFDRSDRNWHTEGLLAEFDDPRTHFDPGSVVSGQPHQGDEAAM